MTKEITKAIILQEIQDKLKLREFDPSAFLFTETVVPVYDIGQHLKTWETRTATKSVTSTGGIIYYIVPETERWLLRAYQLIFYNVGAYTVSGVYITDRPLTSVDFIYLDLKADQAESYLVNLPVPVVLEPGNFLRINVDGYISTADLGLIIDVQVETIR